MKVLHLSSEKTWRGGEQQIAYLIDELEKLEVENIVGCRKNSAFEKYCQQKNIQYISLPFFNQYDPFTAIEVKNICKHLEVDLLHLHSSHSHGVGVLSSVLGNKTPVILSRRVDFPVKNNFISRFKYNHKAVKKIICVSDTIKKIVQKSVRQPNRCVTVHSGIDLTRFEGKTNKGILRKEFSIEPDSLIIGNTSAIAPHKDYFTFVDTAQKVLKEGIKAKFLIIGDGPLREEVENYIKEKGLLNDFIFTGFRTDIPDILPEFDIFLMTSKTEGLGTSILDAFACKVPVVATSGGGIKELVIDGQTGLLNPVSSSENLKESIIDLANSKVLRGKLVEGALKKVQEFSKETTARKTLEVYQSVIRKVPLSSKRDFSKKERRF